MQKLPKQRNKKKKQEKAVDKVILQLSETPKKLAKLKLRMPRDQSWKTIPNQSTLLKWDESQTQELPREAQLGVTKSDSFPQKQRPMYKIKKYS